MSELLFARRLRERGAAPAIVTDTGVRLSYAQLAEAVEAQAAHLPGPGRLVILEIANTIDCVVAYLACLHAGYPVVLAEPGSTAADPRTSLAYGAALVYREGAHGWGFETLPGAQALQTEPHPELCILLSTSGTTGSPKLVRLSRANIQSNAAAIADYLGINADDRAITSLPLYYSYGMSVLNSHLHAGAAILLTARSVADPQFWTFFEEEAATSLSGVPFTFDLLERMGFRGRHYPSLRYLAQAGGRLPAERVRLYAQWAAAARKQVFVMYGQTEASPRMAYVPPEQLLENIDAIGIAIPGGSFELIGEDGEPVLAADTPGELVYRGPNVMMGYAESAADLALGCGPDVLRTGDLACRKENGCYAIVGRKSRFSKIVGLRISLDEIERWVHARGLQGIVSGDDALVVVALTGAADSAGVKQELRQALAQRFGLPLSALAVLHLDALPVLPSNKFDYRAVLRLGHEAAAQAQAQPGQQRLIDAYRDILGNPDVRPQDSFLDLGGDSINLVELSLALEQYLGTVPDNWEAQSIASLEALKDQPAAAPSGAANDASWRSSGLLRAGLVALALLAGGEALLQARAYLKTGRSALDLATGQSRVAMNAHYGVKTYRPNLRDVSQKEGREFSTNSLGFRSAEITPEPAPGEFRLVVVGASTVAGAYAKTNSATFPALLERQLRQAMPGRTVNVINAGVEGYTLREIEILVERGIMPLRPTAVLVYAGFNDMAYICRNSAGVSSQLQPLPAPALPGWTLSGTMIAKNTVALRDSPGRAGIVDPTGRIPDSYRQGLDSIVTKLEGAGIAPVLLTVARGFRPEDGAAGRKLATSALYYNHCLDYAGLNKAGNLFNGVIAEVARSRKVPLVDLGQAMPGGPKYFVDAAHFTAAGEEAASQLIYQALVNDTQLVRPAGVVAHNSAASH